MSSTEQHGPESLFDPTNPVEGIVALFEAAQQRGEEPAIEAFLPEAPQLRLAALVELAHADLEFRLKRGEATRVETLEGFADVFKSACGRRGPFLIEFRI